MKTAREVFNIEAEAITQLSKQLDNDYELAVSTILAAKGRVVVCGMGKSGLIGKKIAATLASTGTPSFFMHPSEAFHGDLGMVTADDVFLAISNSGETEELLKLMPFLTDSGNYIIAMTGYKNSSLARIANTVLNIGVEKEACPLQLAPTASTTATLAMGDALAVTLMQARDFQPEHFARFHPGGNLGRRLLATVKDEMQTQNLPLIKAGASFAELIHCISSGQLGLAIVQNEESIGITTDGDIRRAFEKYHKDVFELKAADLMTASPKTINANAKMNDAFMIMEQHQITALIVQEKGEVVGILKK